MKMSSSELVKFLSNAFILVPKYIKNTDTSGLLPGEMGINFDNGKIYFKHPDTGVILCPNEYEAGITEILNGLGELHSLPMKYPVTLSATGNVPSLIGLLTVDGVATTDKMRVLLTKQTNKKNNGIWIVTPDAWYRATDFDATGDLVPNAMIYVTKGATNAGKTYYLKANDPITIGTDDIIFVESNTSSMLDENGKQIVRFNGVINAVNNLVISNSIAGSPVELSVEGPGGNIGVNIKTKGISKVQINGFDVAITFRGAATIPITGWVANPTGDYPYKYNLAIEGVLASDWSDLRIDKDVQDTAADAGISPTVDEYDGGVTIYAKNVPIAPLSVLYRVVR